MSAVLRRRGDGGAELVTTTGKARTIDGGQAAPLSWRDVYVAAVGLEVSTVLVHGGLGELVDDGRDGIGVEVTGDQGGAWRWRLSSPASFLCGPGAPGRVGGQAVDVVDVAADVARVSGSWDAVTARELVDVLQMLERLLGVPCRSSVGRTAEALILSTHPRGKGGTLLDRSPATPAPCEGSSLELPYVAWRRELTRDESRRQWLHSFDANAQYLGAWSTVELGHGVPVHQSGPRFDSRVAGVWRVPGLEAVRVPFGELLPAPWLPGREWFTTPTIVRALEVCAGGDLPAPVEAWVWPSRSRFLRGAAERLRDARKSATDALAAGAAALWAAGDVDDVDPVVRRMVTAAAVLESVKSIYRVQTGRFGMAGRDAASPWRRPDWGHEVRAQARVNLHRRLTKLTVAPFGIATDGLLFVDDEPDAAKFARRIGLTVGDGLGEFHHGGTVRAGDVAGVLADGRPAAIFAAMDTAAGGVS